MGLGGHSNKFGTTRQQRSDRLGRSAERAAASATRSSGRSRVQVVNLANGAAYVIARIVLTQLSGQHLANSNFTD